MQYGGVLPVDCLGKNSLNVDCLSQQPDMPTPQDDDDEIKVAARVHIKSS